MATWGTKPCLFDPFQCLPNPCQSMEQSLAPAQTPRTYLVWWVDQCQGSPVRWQLCASHMQSGGSVPSRNYITCTLHMTPCGWESPGNRGPTDAQTSVALGCPEFLVLGGHGAGISKSSHARFWSSQIPVSSFTGFRTLCSVCSFCGCHG